MAKSTFEWDEAKDLDNQEKHGVSFEDAQHAFLDENRIIAEDLDHSKDEQRYYCFGLNRARTGILTVRFTYRASKIRIYGAGYWRKGRRIYEKSN
ncbi:MAG: BrnT family toxin [Pseudohongiellaceae bacterium]